MGCTRLPMLLGISTYVVDWVYCNNDCNNVRNKKKLLCLFHLVWFDAETC